MSLSFDDFQPIVNEFTYKPGWHLQVKRDGYRAYLQVEYDGSGTYGSERWSGRKWFLSPHMTRTEIQRTVRKAVHAAELHEADEQLLLRGQSVFSPHLNYDDVATLLANGLISLDQRAPMECL